VGPALPSLAAGLLVAVFATFLVIGVPVQVMHAGYGLWFTEIMVFLALPWVVLRQTGRAPGPLAFTPGFTWKLALFGFGAGVANWAAGAVPLMAAAQSFLPKSLVETFDSAAVFRDRAPGEIAVLAVGAAVAAPVCEEFFFRGVVQQGFERRLGGLKAVLLTAFLFSAFHMDPVGFVPRFELGLVFGALALKTRSIWPGVFAHAANNLTSTLAYFSDPSADDAPVVWSQVGLAFLVGAVGVVILVVLARRFPAFLTPPTQWKEERPAPKPLAQVVAPWLLAALVGAGVTWAVDWRGVKLNAIDLANQAHRPKPDAPEALQKRWDALMKLRLEARRGEVPLAQYEAARKAERQAQRQR